MQAGSSGSVRPVRERGQLHGRRGDTVRLRRQAGKGSVPATSATPRHCETVDDTLELIRAKRAETPDALFAADLFSGAGGLSLGLHDAGFNVVVGADHYAEALETHRHHFPGLTVDWDLAESDSVEEIGRLVREGGIDLVAGGPPCQPFSKAGRSKIRHRVRNGMRDPHDERRDLWRSFFEVVRLSMPRAVLMENVPDMALDKEMFILRSIVEELEELGYSVEERVVETWRYGVPQFRQRLILVALRDGLAFDWPTAVPERDTVWNAIGDMPEVEGGWRLRAERRMDRIRPADHRLPKKNALSSTFRRHEQVVRSHHSASERRRCQSLCRHGFNN